MISFFDALLGLPNQQQAVIYWGFAQNGYIHEAVRIGNLKGVRMFGQSILLFNIMDDPTESSNIAELYPEIIEQIAAIMAVACIYPKYCAYVPIGFGE